MSPPWTVTVYISGHTFAGGPPGEEPLPSFQVHRSNIAMPPCSPGVPAFDTLELSNTSDVPVVVDVASLDFAGELPRASSDQGEGGVNAMGLRAVTPQLLLRPRQTRLITITAAPSTPDLFENDLSVTSSDASTHVHVSVSCVEPVLRADRAVLDVGSVAVGHTARRAATVRNRCGVVCFYTARCSARSGGALALVTTGGVLEPNDEQQLVVVVSPSTVGDIEEAITVEYGAVANEPTHMLTIDVSLTAAAPVLESRLWGRKGSLPVLEEARDADADEGPCGSSSSGSSIHASTRASGVLASNSRQSIASVGQGVADAPPHPLTFDIGRLTVGETARVEAVITNTSAVTAFCLLEHNIGSVLQLSASKVCLADDQRSVCTFYF